MSNFYQKICKKLLIDRFYNLYVEGNSTLKQDIEHTILVRGCHVEPDTLQRKFHHLMMYYPEFAFIFFWRIKKQQHKFKHLFTSEFNCRIFGSTKISGGLNCFHPFSTIINAKSIGSNFQFRNSLTIGNKGNDNKLLPTIGNNVTVGAQVVIIGDISIGDNVIIGAGSVVVNDVPSNTVVAGNPAGFIKEN